MRKSYIAVLIAVAIASIFTMAQAPPSDSNSDVLNKIDQEHKATRKFTSDELTRQREEFYTQFDDRAAFYEQEFFETLNTAVTKLAMLWGAILFIVIGLSNMLRITLERKRYRRVEENILNKLRTEMFLRTPPKPQQTQPIYEKPNDPVSAYAMRAPMPQPIEKDGFFARRRRRKIVKQIERIQKEQQKQEAKAALLRAKISPSMTKMPDVPTPPPNMPYKPMKSQDMIHAHIEEQLTKMKVQMPPQVEVYH